MVWDKELAWSGLKVVVPPGPLRLISIVAASLPGEVYVWEFHRPLGPSQTTVFHLLVAHRQRRLESFVMTTSVAAARFPLYSYVSEGFMFASVGSRSRGKAFASVARTGSCPSPLELAALPIAGVVRVGIDHAGRLAGDLAAVVEFGAGRRHSRVP